MGFKYLHELGKDILHLDHRLTPEVRAMFASMASRSPLGGIRKRYAEVVDVVAESLWAETGPNLSLSGWKGLSQAPDILAVWRGKAEDTLTTYPLHPKVQGFFDEFVGRYGHSSIQEQVGDPAIYVENISWSTAWLLFDSPLCAGQEFSTRAVRHKDWPMARETVLGLVECRDIHQILSWDGSEIVQLVPGPIKVDVQHQPDLLLHQDWLEVFDAEVEWWKEHLSEPENRKALGIGDKEPFRPALDRARWALPGTFATGACFTSNLRERARVLQQGRRLGVGVPEVWEEIIQAYHLAQPGIAPYALSRIHSQGYQTPVHLANFLKPVPPLSSMVEINFNGQLSHCQGQPPYVRPRENTYADPWVNRDRVAVRIQCSLAVARDWHRHRTMYPWHLGVVLHDDYLTIHPMYEPKSEYAKAHVPALLQRSTQVYKDCMGRGDVQRAALALPMGTQVVLEGEGGYRDALYMLELRAHAHGANFEYKAQAEQALALLKSLPDVK